MITRAAIILALTTLTSLPMWGGQAADSYDSGGPLIPEQASYDVTFFPELRMKREGTSLALAWITPNGLPFPMPVEVSIGSDLVTVDLTDGMAWLRVPEDATVIADPQSRILKSE